MAEERQRPGLGRAVLLPSALAAAVLGVLGLFLSNFLGDRSALSTGLIGAWAAFTIGRFLAFADKPRGRGVFLRHVLTGVAAGLVGVALLRAIFLEGPGWPWTPWWVLAMGFGWGLYRSHAALLKAARETDDPTKRWLGLFHPKDLEALAVLMAGYAILGVAGYLVFRAFSGFIPGAGKGLAIGIAVYALHGARLLLRFASEDRAAKGTGFVAWMKAHALQNAIVVLLLAGYAIFRDDLSRSLPYYPLIEFGLGIAVFGFVLARLRAKMRREGSPLATASQARDHARIVTELREADYDHVARPVTRFIEAGQGGSEYADAMASVLPADDEAGRGIRERVLAYREPPRTPPLEMEWGFAAGAAMTLGLAIAATTLGFRVFEAEMPYPLYLGLLFVAFGAYAQQDVARSHHRPWLAVGIAGIGTALLLLDFLLFMGSVGSLDLPGIVWGIVAGIVAAMVGFPALGAWRHEKKLAAGALVDARRVSPERELQIHLQATRKRAALMMTVAFLILLPIPWLTGWLAGRGAIPAGFPEFFDDILAVAVWVVAAFGGAALVRFYGLTRGRPRLVAREKEKRERRLTLHKSLMQSIEKV